MTTKDVFELGVYLGYASTSEGFNAEIKPDVKIEVPLIIAANSPPMINLNAPIVKFFAVRDRGTFIPVAAFKVSGANGVLAQAAGFGETPCIQLVWLERGRTAFESDYWGDRTMTVAHRHLEQHFDTLADGSDIDVRVILGEM